MSTPNVPRGPGLFEVPSDTPFVVEHANGKQYAFDNFRELDGMHLEGQERPPGSGLIGLAAWLLALIGAGALYVSFTAQQRYVFAARHQNAASVIEALLLDLLMIVFTLLALGLSRAGKSSRTERALILACAAASAYMNVSAADTASPRSVVAYAVAPIALAVVVDRVVAVIRRHVLADEEASAWTAMGRVRAGRQRGWPEWSCCTRCGSSWRRRRPLRGCAGWCSTRRRCPSLAGDRRSRRRSTRRRPRRPRSWRCTGFTPTTASRPRRAGGRRAGAAAGLCGRVPPAPTCTPSLRAGRHDCRHPRRHRPGARRSASPCAAPCSPATGSGGCAGGSSCGCARARASRRTPRWRAAGPGWPPWATGAGRGRR